MAEPVQVVSLTIVGNRVREFREALGLTQDQLGPLAGLAGGREIWKIETMHQGHVPKVVTSLKLAAALGTTIDQLFVFKMKTRAAKTSAKR